MRKIALGVPAVLLIAGGLYAQSFTTSACSGDNGEGSGSWFSGSQVKVCEMRRTTLPMTGEVNVQGMNGGIEVIGEDRNDIALEAKVIAQGSSREQAESILHEVRVKTNGTIEADGPKTSGWGKGNWSVNYKLRVPKHLAAHLKTMNGGIELSGLDGSIRAETMNGGLQLRDLSGDVHAETVNGGLDISLTGRQWKGAGLVAKSTNGGVSVKAPDHYSAHLVAETVNGGISVGFPVTVEGKIRHHIDTNIGDGGPTLQFETVNGGVSVERD